MIKGKAHEKHNGYSHFFLYAKGWYKITDTFEDLRKILENYCGTPKEYIDKQDVISMLSSIAYIYITSENLQSIFHDISNPHCYRFRKDTPIDERIALRLLLVLTFVKLEDIEDGLYAPDYTILPKKEK